MKQLFLLVAIRSGNPCQGFDNLKFYNRKNIATAIVKYANLIIFMKMFLMEYFLFIPETITFSRGNDYPWFDMGYAPVLMLYCITL